MLLKRFTKKLKTKNFIIRNYNYDAFDKDSFQDLEERFENLTNDNLYKAHMKELEDMENEIWMDFNMNETPRNQFTVGKAKSVILEKRKKINKKYTKLYKDRENPKKSEKAKLQLHQIMNDLNMNDDFLSFQKTFSDKAGVEFDNKEVSKSEVEEFVHMLKYDKELKEGIEEIFSNQQMKDLNIDLSEFTGEKKKDEGMSKEAFEHVIQKERERNPYADELIERFVPNFRDIIKKYDNEK
eukprot:gene3420-5965_t